MSEQEINNLIYQVIGAAMTVHTEIGYGLIIHFKHPSLQWRKVTLNPSYAQQSQLIQPPSHLQ
jgi:hypothetical protein